MIRKYYKKFFPGIVFAIFCLVPQVSFATPLRDLFAGGTYQFHNLKLTDWQLVNAANVNINNIDIGPYFSDGLSVLPKNRALAVNQGGYGRPHVKNLSFDFLVTGMGVNITGLQGDMGFRSVNGYRWNSPWITGSIAIGTSKGSNDLGRLTDVFSLNRDNKVARINLPDGGLNQIWMRTAITVNSSRHGYAEAGFYRNGYGPAFSSRFSTHAAAPVPVPEPTCMLLLSTGLAMLLIPNLRGA